MKDKEYEKHKLRCKEYYRDGKGKIKSLARRSAIYYLIQRHSREYLKLRRTYEKALLDEQPQNPKRR